MKKLLFVFAAAAALFLTSCTAEITITSSSKGVELAFNGAAQKGFEKLVKSLGAENQAFIDTVQINEEFTNSGFTNVKVSQKNTADLSVSMVAPDFNNFLFKSEILCLKDNIWVADFSKDKLAAFYASADSSIIQVLDLLLAPVFNEEEMTVEEYLEIIASFYGDSVADELASSKVKVVSKGSAVITKSYSLPEILCGLVQ